VRLIGRNHDLIGQLLKGLEDEGTKKDKENKKKKRGYSVNRFADKRECSKSIKIREC